MDYCIPDETLWEEVKSSVNPLKRKVKRDLPKRLRVVRKSSSESKNFLDLHGQTVQQAFESTNTFIKRACRAGISEVLIVTGRGSMGQSLIKNEFEGWLNNPKINTLVRSFTWKNRGGAVKLILKKK